jgi:hypothetical protein
LALPPVARALDGRRCGAGLVKVVVSFGLSCCLALFGAGFSALSTEPGT